MALSQYLVAARKSLEARAGVAAQLGEALHEEALRVPPRARAPTACTSSRASAAIAYTSRGRGISPHATKDGTRTASAPAARGVPDEYGMHMPRIQFAWGLRRSGKAGKAGTAADPF